MSLSPNFLRMIRYDFLSLLLNPKRHPYAYDRRLARDLHDLGGMAGEW